MPERRSRRRMVPARPDGVEAQLATARSCGLRSASSSAARSSRPAHRLVERLAVDRLGVGQRRLAELAREDLVEAPVLADDLRARADEAVDGDQHGVGLLAQGIALEQPVGRGAAHRPGRRRPGAARRRSPGRPRTGRTGVPARRRSNRGRGPRAGRRGRARRRPRRRSGVGGHASNRSTSRSIARPSGSRPCPPRCRGGPGANPASARPWRTSQSAWRSEPADVAVRRPATGRRRSPRGSAAGGPARAGRRVPGRGGRSAGWAGRPPSAHRGGRADRPAA